MRPAVLRTLGGPATTMPEPGERSADRTRPGTRSYRSGLSGISFDDPDPPYRRPLLSVPVPGPSGALAAQSAPDKPAQPRKTRPSMLTASSACYASYGGLTAWPVQHRCRPIGTPSSLHRDLTLFIG